MPAIPNYVPSQYRDYVSATSAKYGVDPVILAAVIQGESSWDINAGDNVDSYNSYGLGQLIQMNWASYPQYQPGDAAGQIDTVGQILSGNFRATGSWNSAIAAYNTGLGGYTSAAGQRYTNYIWGIIGNPPAGSQNSAPALGDNGVASLLGATGAVGALGGVLSGVDRTSMDPQQYLQLEQSMREAEARKQLAFKNTFLTKGGSVVDAQTNTILARGQTDETTEPHKDNPLHQGTAYADQFIPTDEE